MSHCLPYGGGLKLNEGFHVWELGKIGWGSGRMSACQSICLLSGRHKIINGELWVVNHGETQTQILVKLLFSTKLRLVSIQGLLNVLCLIREMYSRPGAASLLCAWKLVLKKKCWQLCFTVSTTLGQTAAGLWLSSPEFTAEPHPPLLTAFTPLVLWLTARTPQLFSNC